MSTALKCIVVVCALGSFGASRAWPEEDGAPSEEAVVRFVRELVERGCECAQEIVTIRRLPGKEEPFSMLAFDFMSSRGRERWQMWPRYAYNEAATAEMARVMQDANGDSRVLSTWVRTARTTGISLYDGRRQLVAGRTKEMWWTEHLHVGYSFDRRPRSHYGWLWGPGQRYLTRLMQDAKFTYSAARGSQREVVFVLDRHDVFRKDTPLLETTSVVICVGIAVENAGDGLQLASVRHTKLRDSSVIRAVASALESDAAALYSLADLGGDETFLLTVMETGVYQLTRVPTHILARKWKGDTEEHFIDWRPPTPISIDVSRRLPETEGAEYYFRIDDLTGETLSSQGAGAVAPWRGYDDDEQPGAMEAVTEPRSKARLVIGVLAGVLGFALVVVALREGRGGRVIA